jgi:hypothetical protein
MIDEAPALRIPSLGYSVLLFRQKKRDADYIHASMRCKGGLVYTVLDAAIANSLADLAKKWMPSSESHVDRLWIYAKRKNFHAPHSSEERASQESGE